ncbi:Gfo/Idh/MocA family oxidoreductase [Cohnella fermenti]|uniref:Gfo/Idh/MocA family oxidoreductase n=2 Tax=Cohnella fermenti TaxID=2565925 RepID=A0A4S4C316_9BACL|nr:Gfo/Idh/MocA family oxidoreductase [Cohnella fermenti]THF82117.1 Gfo/Idh/MocA family oxidoreductase [Cohnella fermenti]
MVSPGPESWHPNPGFLYEEGAGPLFDMGPYYLSALVNLLGPVKRVTGSAQIASPERIITNPANYGAKIPVETPTHIAGVLDFASGAFGSLITSFDVWGSELPDIEIYGTKGTLSVPHPNFYDGKVKVRRHNRPGFEEIPLTHGFTQNSRGLGVMDMAHAIRGGREHRASGELCLHVLETMHGLLLSSREGHHYKLQSKCSRPEAFPTDLPEHALDL